MSTSLVKSSILLKSHATIKTNENEAIQLPLGNYNHQSTGSVYWKIVFFLVGYGILQIKNENSSHNKVLLHDKTSNDIDTYSQEFHRYLQQGRYEDAIKAIDKVISLSSDNPGAY